MNSALDQFTADFKDKKILILGLGLLGSALEDTRIFASLGCRVRVTDTKSAEMLKPSLDKLHDLNLEFTLGRHLPEDIEWADVVVRNPGIPREHPLLVLAQKLHKQIVMDASLTAKYARIPVIGITGTRGKSTTTLLIFQLLQQTADYDQVLLGGNLPGSSSLSLLSQIKPDARQLLVMELSSWQLQGFADEMLSPHISVITNLYPDHLNYYPTMAAYAQDKKLIYQFQTPQDYLILNRDQAIFTSWANEARSQISWFSGSDLPSGINLKLAGHHNRENVAAALAVAKVLELPSAKVMTVVENFTPLPFRLEQIKNYKNVRIINDTTSTTPIAAIKAIEAITGPIILICGGSAKNLPVQELAQTINSRVKAVILLSGTGTKQLKIRLRPDLIKGEFQDISAAVRAGVHLAVPFAPATLLFSPGFTSFGMFQNEFDRGQQFNQVVGKLT